MGASPSVPSMDDMVGTYTLKPQPSDCSFVSADASESQQVEWVLSLSAAAPATMHSRTRSDLRRGAPAPRTTGDGSKPRCLARPLSVAKCLPQSAAIAAGMSAGAASEFSFALTRQLLEHPPFNATYGSSAGVGSRGAQGMRSANLNRCTYYGRARIGGTAKTGRGDGSYTRTALQFVALKRREFQPSGTSMAPEEEMEGPCGPQHISALRRPFAAPYATNPFQLSFNGSAEKVKVQLPAGTPATETKDQVAIMLEVNAPATMVWNPKKVRNEQGYELVTLYKLHADPEEKAARMRKEIERRRQQQQRDELVLARAAAAGKEVIHRQGTNSKPEADMGLYDMLQRDSFDTLGHHSPGQMDQFNSRKSIEVVNLEDNGQGAPDETLTSPELHEMDRSSMM